MPETGIDLLKILGLTSDADAEGANSLKKKQKLPELDKYNLHIALSKLNNAGYSGLDDVASVLMPNLRGLAEGTRYRVSAFLANDVPHSPSGQTDFMDSESIMLALVHLFVAKYPDILGVAKLWIPDFDRKMELMEAKNPKIIPTIYNKTSEKGGYDYMVRICYEMDRPVSIKELDSATDKACCSPAMAVELDTVHDCFPEMLKLPAAAVYKKRMDNATRFNNLRLIRNRFIRKARRFYRKILHNLNSISDAISGGGYIWYVIPDPEKPLQTEKGNRMPAGVQFVAVCLDEFFKPLQKK